jgi:alanyl-tRNA synthetase
MGDQGPCGPCSEIHVDIRSAEEKALVSGKSLVNNDHPQVVEFGTMYLWNSIVKPMVLSKNYLQNTLIPEWI